MLCGTGQKRAPDGTRRKDASCSSSFAPAGIGTLQSRLPWFHRAGPSATLDKGMLNCPYCTRFSADVKTLRESAEADRNFRPLFACPVRFWNQRTSAFRRAFSTKRLREISSSSARLAACLCSSGETRTLNVPLYSFCGSLPISRQKSR